MQPRKLDVLFAFFPYGGNGSTSSEVPAVRSWMANVAVQCATDPRIGRWAMKDFSDTPITMTRNAAALYAKQAGFDVIVMVDSDQSPDCELATDSLAKPFWDSSFDFVYDHYEKGPVMVAAPYCGPPPNELVYIFFWENKSTGEPVEECMKLEMISRLDAAQRTGIEECAAIPTGLSIWDMRLFDITAPKQRGDSSWFEYEWHDHYKSRKVTTEDVFVSRNMSMAAIQTLGYNPIHVNWYAWAGHWKPKMVRKPAIYPARAVSDTLVRAIKNETAPHEERVWNVSTDLANSIDWSTAQVASNDGAFTPNEKMVYAVEGNLTWPLVYNVATGRFNMGLMTPVNDSANVMNLASLAQERAMLAGAQRFVVVEVGTWLGETAAKIIEVSGTSQPPIRLFCVDPHTGAGTAETELAVEEIGGPERMAQLFFHNTGGYHDVRLQQVTSAQAAETWGATGDIHFCYLDGDHSHEGIKTDIESWLPLMHPQGILAGHDFGGGFPAVEEVVREKFGSCVKTFPDSVVWWVDMVEWLATQKASTNGHKPGKRKPMAKTRGR